MSLPVVLHVSALAPELLGTREQLYAARRESVIRQLLLAAQCGAWRIVVERAIDLEVTEIEHAGYTAGRDS